VKNQEHTQAKLFMSSYHFEKMPYQRWWPLKHN